MQAADATVEWSVLQNQFDSYEKYSLIIKLVNTTLMAALTALALPALAAILVVVLWLQDAIWKTFQSRIETRLLRLEAFFANEQTAMATGEKPFQLNQQYQASRGGTLALCREYFAQAIRPTVAFPHGALLVISIFLYGLSCTVT